MLEAFHPRVSRRAKHDLRNASILRISVDKWNAAFTSRRIIRFSVVIDEFRTTVGQFVAHKCTAEGVATGPSDGELKGLALAEHANNVADAVPRVPRTLECFARTTTTSDAPEAESRR